MLARLKVPVGWGEILKRTGKEVIADDCLSLSAQLAYYFFLALFPALLFVVALASFLPIERVMDDIINRLAQVAPPEVLNIVRDQLQKIATGEQGGLLTIGVILALWSSSTGMVAVVNTLNTAYDIEEGRPWWKVRLTAIGLTVLLAIFILVSFALVVAGPQFAEQLAGWVGLGQAFVWAWWILQWPVVFFLVVSGVALVYYVAPDAEQEFVLITPGALLATGLWLLFSLAFRFYVVNFASYTETYGAIGAVIVVLLWFYASGLAILIGAELNSEIEHASPYGKEPGEKKPGEKRKLGAVAERAWLAARRQGWGRAAPAIIPLPATGAAAGAAEPAPAANATPDQRPEPGVATVPPHPARPQIPRPRARPRDMVIGGIVAAAIETLRRRRVRE